MNTAVAETNGHGPAPSPTGDTTGAPTPPDETKPTTPKEKALLLDPDTHRLVREAAKRLGRPNAAIVRRAIHLLNQATAQEQAKSHKDWADEVAS